MPPRRHSELKCQGLKSALSGLPPQLQMACAVGFMSESVIIYWTLGRHFITVSPDTITRTI